MDNILEVLTARQKHKMKLGTVKDQKKLKKTRLVRQALIQLMKNGPPN